MWFGPFSTRSCTAWQSYRLHMCRDLCRDLCCDHALLHVCRSGCLSLRVSAALNYCHNKQSYNSISQYISTCQRLQPGNIPVYTRISKLITVLYDTTWRHGQSSFCMLSVAQLHWSECWAHEHFQFQLNVCLLPLT